MAIVRQFDMLQIGVGFGIRGHGANPQFAASALDSQRRLAAVGDEYFFRTLG